MPDVDWEFHDTGRVLAASLKCCGEPRLESGKRGWYQVSEHIPWRFNWQLQVRSLIAEPKADYGLAMSPKGQRKITFDDGLGWIDIDGESLALSFRIPDCLDPPKKKSFIWQGGIYLAETAFHSQIKLVIVNPKDGSDLRRFEATSTRTGGVAFVSPDGRDLGQIRDSEVRGRSERIRARVREKRPEYLEGTPDSKGRTRINQRSFFDTLAEAAKFVDSRPADGE